MGKSTHPFVLKMNEAKAFHRAMRAGAAKEQPAPEAAEAETPAEAPKAGTRYLTLTHKAPSDAPPPKGVLSIVVPK